MRRKAGGEGGIRTHGTRKGSTVFETARFNRSRTSPWVQTGRNCYCHYSIPAVAYEYSRNLPAAEIFTAASRRFIPIPTNVVRMPRSTWRMRRGSFGHRLLAMKKGVRRKEACIASNLVFDDVTHAKRENMPAEALRRQSRCHLLDARHVAMDPCAGHYP